MKKRFYLLAVVGLVFMGGSIFMMARLWAVRIGQISKELEKQLTFEQLDTLYNEAARAGGDGGLLKILGDRRTLARLNEEKDRIDIKSASLNNEIKRVESEITAESIRLTD